jgi:hypothetical protein
MVRPICTGRRGDIYGARLKANMLELASEPKILGELPDNPLSPFKVAGVIMNESPTGWDYKESYGDL